MTRLFTIAAYILATLSFSSAAHAETPKVAIIDSGIQKIREIPGVTIHGFDARDGLPVAIAQGNWQGEHGTIVASVLFNNYAGPLDVYAYRAETSCKTAASCNMSVNAMIRAMRHAVTQGVTVIQISSYGDYGQLGEDVIVSLASLGIDFVLAAGNEGGRSKMLAMAARNPEHIHIVGSLDKNGRHSEFSANEGRGIDEGLMRWVRGVDLDAYGPHNKRTVVDGTSFAASVYTAQLLDRQQGTAFASAR